MVVADASLAVKWVIREPYFGEARRLLRDWEDAGRTVVAPSLYASECTQAFHWRVSEGLITLAQAQGLLDALIARGVRMMRPATPVLKRSMEIASTLGLSNPYDCQYAATAEGLRTEFWTGDKIFRDAAQATLPFVHWIGERTGTT